MESKNNLIDWCLRHWPVPLSMALVLVALGFYGIGSMPRNEFPDFTVRTGLVVGYYPGASSQQVEERLTAQVEKYLFSYEEVDKTKTYSYSKDGMMYIYVEVGQNVNDANTKNFWNKLKTGLFVFQSQLPREVRGIVVNSDFGNTSAILLSVESKTRPYKDLQKHVEEIEDKLRQVSEVSRISHSGNIDQQIAVYVDNTKLANYGLSSSTIINVLQREGAISPSGVLDGVVTDRPLHLSTFYRSPSDLAEQIISNDGHGNIVRLRDVADIRQQYPKPTSLVTVNGVKCMLISMEMAKGNNIVHFGEQIDKKLEEIKKGLPADIQLGKLANQPEVVDESISHFMEEFAFALIGVVIVTMLLLPLRIASVAAATIPITIAATLAVMYLMGIQLDTVTLAALIVVLGIVVDDPIVVIDNHVEKLDEGHSLWDAAVSSARQLFPSVFTATLAISATFAPLVFFMKGTSRDFIGNFPVVIIIALTLSLIISMLLVPFFNTRFVKTGVHNRENKRQGKSVLDRLQALFDKHVGNAIDHWVITICIGMASVIAGVLLLGQLDQQLFPKVERNQCAMEIYLPNGYTVQQTEKTVKGIEKILAVDNRVVSYTSFIGSSSPRFHTLYAPNLPAKNYAQILLNTTTAETTEQVLDEYRSKYSNFFPEAYIRLKQLTMVSSPAPIEIRISGDDIQTLKKTGKQISEKIASVPNVTWIRTDYENMVSSVQIDIKKDESARLGISKEDIANTISMNMDGISATNVWDGNYALNVMLKTPQTDSSSIADLENMTVISPQTRTSVPMRMVADIKPEWNEGQIVRRNGKRTLTVRADVTMETVPENVLKMIGQKINGIQLPKGIEISYGGEHELQMENMGPMGLALMVSIILIFLILVTHFKSIKHALLSITTMPLALFGTAVGLILMNYPFGFTSFIGLLALCGIVVRNGIILIDFADEMRLTQGMDVRQAAIHAAERRMRPIFLTSSAAAVGVVPMIISRSSLWGPLGTVICFGLLGAMVFTLLVLPVLYWLFFRNDQYSTSGLSALQTSND